VRGKEFCRAPALCAWGLCAAGVAGRAGAVLAADAEAATAAGALGGVTPQGKPFGVLTWTDHADDWRGRLVGEHFAPLRGPGALRPLGRVSAPALRSDAVPGLTLEADPRHTHLMLRYRLSF
jgi:hypothetical protein